MVSTKHPRPLPAWASACLILVVAACGVIAWPRTAAAEEGKCCSAGESCGCGEGQCCPYEDLGALKCSEDDPDYCRSTCDGLDG
jgi:hypothetical protein